jgi:hypothetical protein
MWSKIPLLLAKPLVKVYTSELGEHPVLVFFERGDYKDGYHKGCQNS